MFNAHCTYNNKYYFAPGVVYYYSLDEHPGSKPFTPEAETNPNTLYYYSKINILTYEIVPTCKRKIIYKMNREVKLFFVFCLIVLCILVFGSIIYNIY